MTGRGCTNSVCLVQRRAHLYRPRAAPGSRCRAGSCRQAATAQAGPGCRSGCCRRAPPRAAGASGAADCPAARTMHLAPCSSHCLLNARWDYQLNSGICNGAEHVLCGGDQVKLFHTIQSWTSARDFNLRNAGPLRQQGHRCNPARDTVSVEACKTGQSWLATGADLEPCCMQQAKDGGQGVSRVCHSSLPSGSV